MMNSRPLGGKADLVQIIEFHGPTHDAQWMLPDSSPQIFEANASWLTGHFWMPRTNRLIFTYQLWLLKMSDAIILVDTGCGNHKVRLSPYQNMINTPVIDWLEAVGAPPDKVTHVLHTHLHSDHVGWNTRLVAGRWVPTFPNATYYMPKLDYEVFTSRRARMMAPEMYEGVLADSVIPILDAGLTRFVEDGDEVAGLRAAAAPGHTPGSLVYTLRHGGDEIIFSGDVLHSPLQVLFPRINSRWCEDQEMARTTRHALLKRAAASGAAIVPAHAKGIHGWRIGRKGDGFSVGFDERLTTGSHDAPLAQATAPRGRRIA
jgi:glyoxylase-like metal-dependent hydrolase (beta-lactamase superfamily II)